MSLKIFHSPFNLSSQSSLIVIVNAHRNSHEWFLLKTKTAITSDSESKFSGFVSRNAYYKQPSVSSVLV